MQTLPTFVICLSTHALYVIAKKIISFGNEAVKMYKKNSVPEYPNINIDVYFWDRFLNLVLVDLVGRFPRRAGCALVYYHFICF